MTNQPKPQPKTVSELFPSKYLSADDLRGQAYKLTIAAVEFVQIHDRYEGDITKAALRFQGAQKLLILNITQARAIAEIAASETFSEWVGKSILLRPGRAHNGKPTIFVDPAPAHEIG